MIHALLFAAAAASLSTAQVDAMLARTEAAFLHYYVFPDVADKTVAMLRANTPRYEKLSDPKTLIASLNADLYTVSHDKHVHIEYPFDVARLKSTRPNEAAMHEADFRLNYGFREVERLPGNVGYLDFRWFSDDAAAGDVIAAAMHFLAGTDALIIDLRQNGGGSPRAAQTLEAYFFADQQQITSIIERDPGTGKIRETQQYTAATVPGPLYLNKPVYLLTSGDTFSCAEQFTYDLHNLKRATVVGETTGGGANPGDLHAIAKDAALFIPSGRAYSDVTKTNWEHTGITPDIAVPAKQALLRAYTAALHDVQKNDGNAYVQRDVKRALEDPHKALMSH